MTLLPLVGLLAIVGFYTIIRFPSVAICFTVLLTILGRTLDHFSSSSVVSSIDELAVLACFIGLPAKRVLGGGSLRRFPGMLFFTLFAILGLSSDLHHHVPNRIAVASLFLAVKGIILGFSAAQVDWTPLSLRRIERLIQCLMVVYTASIMINLLIPGPWARIFADSGTATHRAGVPVLIGLFVHPGDFGQISAFLTILLYVRRTGAAVSRPKTSGLAIAFFATVLSLRRASIASMLVALAVVRTRRKVASSLISLVILLPALVLVLLPSLHKLSTATYEEYLANPDKAARTVLYQTSVDVAREDFPLGAGFGRYGTHEASVHYSPVYVEYGFNNIYGLGTGTDGSFLTDTYWPAVLGETGILGAVSYACGILAIISYGWRRSKSHLNGSPIIGMILVGWVIQAVGESLANPVFTAPPSYGLIFVATGLLCSRTSADDVKRRSRGDKIDASSANKFSAVH